MPIIFKLIVYGIAYPEHIWDLLKSKTIYRCNSTALLFLKGIRNLVYRWLKKIPKKQLDALLKRPSVWYLRRLLGAYRLNARCYLRNGLSESAFFNELNKRGVSYVILRWWENYPQFEKGEDLDILVADEDLSKLSGLFTERPFKK